MGGKGIEGESEGVLGERRKSRTVVSASTLLRTVLRPFTKNVIDLLTNCLAILGKTMAEVVGQGSGADASRKD